MITGRFILMLLSAIALAASAAAQSSDNRTPDERAMAGLEPEQKIGEKVPLDARFVDDLGGDVTIGDYFNQGRPVILTFNYFNCPQLCSLQLNGLVASLKAINLSPGKDYELVTVSFDPLEGKALARLKKESYVAALGKPTGSAGWHFLTGNIDNIRRLTRGTGFVYRWDSELKTYAHPAMAVLCSPDGTINRYFGGIVFDDSALRLGIVDASQGRVGSLWDSVFLTCYMYDSKAGKYVPFALGMMKVGGGITLVVLIVALLLLFRFESIRRRRALAAADVEKT